MKFLRCTVSTLAKLPTFARARVGVNRATCDSALPTKEEDRKNKEVQEEETDERRHRGRGVGAGTGQEVYG